MMDFSIKIYKKLLEKLIEKKYSFQTLQEYIQAQADKVVLLRHDVDANPVKSLQIANVENSLGIRSTYYFKTKKISYDESIIRKIASLGNEIGYHYEDLSDTHGDYDKAIFAFQQNLEIIRRLYPVKTICMDGNAWSKWSNLDLWKKFDYKDYDIIAEPYLDLDFDKILYLTDTGRKWNAVKYSIWDKVETKFNYYNKSTYNILEDIANDNLPNHVLITTHPQRWTDKPLPWLKELLLQSSKNAVKYWIVRSGSRR